MNFKPLIDFLDNYVPMIGIPGSDTIIYKGREEIFRHTSGYDSLKFKTPVRKNALYNLYSCTKVATCVAAVQLIERGEILTTDPLYAYFPEYKDMKVKVVDSDGSVMYTSAKNPILIQHLLTMTAGFNYDLESNSIKELRAKTDGKCPTIDFVRALANEPLEFEPGTRHRYSLCLDVVGGLIELVSGMKYGEYMRQNVFEPLGMMNTSFSLTDEKKDMLACQYQYDSQNRCAVEIPATQNIFRLGTEFESAGAGLISSVEDQILLADALTHFGVGKNGNRILSKYGVNLMRSNMLSPELRKDFTHVHMAGYSYGYGVRVNMTPELCGNLAPKGEFGWDGAKMCYISSDPENEISFFHAEHMGALHALVHPKLRNLVYACIGD